MNRVIKFRGKSVLNKKWMYGSFVLCTHNAIADICDIVTDNNDMTQTPVLSYTVGQFTGLCDINGREIYEGDIVRVKGNTVDKDFGVVMFHKNGYFYIDDSFGEFPRDCVKPIGDFFNSISRNDFFQGMKFYVNGNIHDNKIK